MLAERESPPHHSITDRSVDFLVLRHTPALDEVLVHLVTGAPQCLKAGGKLEERRKEGPLRQHLGRESSLAIIPTLLSGTDADKDSSRFSPDLRSRLVTQKERYSLQKLPYFSILESKSLSQHLNKHGI
ncbi:hypothetical protein FRC02_006374 [Tulasnella sp. 418]|nr:hypothetical protein FRC02_006374 [Tulasnella sp. 418]